MALFKPVLPESEKGVKKLVSVLAISTPVTGTRKKAVEIAKAIKTAGASKNGTKSGGKYPNLA